MPSKQMHSLEQFLAQAQGPSLSWADVDDDPELYATADEPALEALEQVQPPSRSSRPPVPNLPSSPPFVIYCGNLSYNCTDQHLKEFFASIKPLEARVVADPNTKRGKGFGYVEFRTRDEMERAFDRNAELLLNRPIRIDVQNNRENTMERPPRHYAPPPPPAPVERPKLVLKPRTVDVNKPTVSASQKMNPFGAARPREEVLKEKAAAAAAAAVSEEQKTAADKQSRSPARSRATPTSAGAQPQKMAWGPVRSVLPTPPPTAEPASTPKEPQQRPAWGSQGPTPRAESEQNESRPFRPMQSHRGGHQFESRQQGQAGSRPITPQNADKGPVRHYDSERKPGPRPHIGGDRKTGPRSNGGEHRPRYRHGDRRGSREKTNDSESNITPAAVPDTDSQPKPKLSPSSRARSSSPSHADFDDAGFEVQRKGRRNGSGRGATNFGASMPKVNVNNNRKEKATNKSSLRQQVPPAEIPSSVAYSSNIFNQLPELDDD